MATVDPVFKRLVLAFVPMIVLLAMLTPVTVAQQVAADGSGAQASGQPQSGPVDVDYECWGWGASPYWDDYIQLTVTPVVGTGALASHVFVDYGTVYGTVPFTFSLGQASVSIKCEVSYYSSWTGSESDTFSTTVGGRAPFSLTNDTSVESFYYHGPGNYVRRRQYVVGDQYDMVWGFEGEVLEWYQEGSVDECNIVTYTTAQTATNNVGRFGDKYGNHNEDWSMNPVPIPACEIPEYSGCRTESTQYVQVQGVLFDHAVTWRCNDVQVAR